MESLYIKIANKKYSIYTEDYLLARLQKVELDDLTIIENRYNLPFISHVINNYSYETCIKIYELFKHDNKKIDLLFNKRYDQTHPLVFIVNKYDFDILCKFIDIIYNKDYSLLYKVMYDDENTIYHILAYYTPYELSKIELSSIIKY